MRSKITLTGDIRIDEKGYFYQRIDKKDCWEWKGYKSIQGYGRVKIGGTTRAVHRVIYEAFRGKIQDGLVLDHLCRNRACCNPNHLEQVTHKENILRGISIPAINAKKTKCSNGHTLSDCIIKNKKGHRACKTCSKVMNNNYKKKIKIFGLKPLNPTYCNIKGCNRLHRAKGMCIIHYTNMYRNMKRQQTINNISKLLNNK